jgi:hypothetical protein
MANDLVSELGKLGALQDPESTRLMGVVMALAGEVFVLRAQVERLSRALQANGGVTEEALAAAGATEAMQKWLATEETAFARALTQPYLEGDRALNSTRWMREE